MALPLTLLLLLFLLLILPRFIRYSLLQWRLRSISSSIPGPPTIPILGNALGMIGSSESRYSFLKDSGDAVIEEGGNIMRLWIANTIYVFPLSGEAAKVLVDSTTEITKGDDYDFLLDWLGRGLLLSTGTKWRSRRRLLTPTFHFAMLEGYVRTFDEQSKNVGLLFHLNPLPILVDLLQSHNEQPVDLFPFVKRCALDIICETAMGVELNSQRDSNQPYVAAVSEMGLLIMKYTFEPWLWFPPIWWVTGTHSAYKRALKTLTDTTKKVIEERTEAFRRRETETMKGGRKCFLDMLIEMAEKEELNEEDIREEVDTFMFEGHDTTSSGIAWTLWCIATHPQVQKNVHKELAEVFGNDKDKECTIEELKKLNYLERVIKEAMRLCPPVPLVERLLQNDLGIGGHVVPKGATVVLSFFIIHQNKKNFENPECFDPDNFLPERIAKRHAYDYMPFSAGLRNCIGQKFALYEEKVMVSWILRRFQLSTEMRFEDNKRCPEAILRPSIGIPLKLKRRI